MPKGSDFDRRSVLETTGALTVGGALAGCLGGGTGGDGGDGGSSGGGQSGGSTPSLEARVKEEGKLGVVQSMSG